MNNPIPPLAPAAPAPAPVKLPTTIPCCTPIQCGGSLPEELNPAGNPVDLTPYVCPTCYRSGWRAEGLRSFAGGPKVYLLPPDKIPGPVHAPVDPEAVAILFDERTADLTGGR